MTQPKAMGFAPFNPSYGLCAFVYLTLTVSRAAACSSERDA